MTRHALATGSGGRPWLGGKLMSDVLKGLCARKAELERRIAAEQDLALRTEQATGPCDPDDALVDLHLQLKSINNQIKVYSGHALRTACAAG